MPGTEAAGDIGGEMKLYLMVTDDKYELPLCVADSVKELVEFSGKTYMQICSLMSKHKYGKIKKATFLSVEVEEEEE